MKTTAAQQQQPLDKKALEAKVKAMYTEVALYPEGRFHFEMGRGLAEKLGYPPALLDAVPKEAVASFAGVGYYFHLAAIKEGERIADLGSGSGMDAFIAALQTGSSGVVFGIDMTTQQLEKSELLGKRDGFTNAHFHKGYIEKLPIPDASLDVVISNGVINLSAEKALVFHEAARVLKPGGRFVLSDIVTGVALPDKISCNASLWAACIGGTVTIETYERYLEAAGMQLVKVEENPAYTFLSRSAQGAMKDYNIRSISILARKQ